jgi:hypothetical protein
MAPKKNSQLKKFKDAARAIKADLSEGQFKEALKRVAKHQPSEKSADEPKNRAVHGGPKGSSK